MSTTKLSTAPFTSATVNGAGRSSEAPPVRPDTSTMTPLPPDSYKILGLSKDAQIPEIRSAHRKLVLKCHPDKVQDPRFKVEKQDEFQKVQQAYELLSDDAKRRKYDDQVKLAELCKVYQTKSNTSAPRSSPKESNIYNAEPSLPVGRGSPPVSKNHAFSGSWDDEIGRGPRMFDAGTPRSFRIEASFLDRPSKLELDRDRERKREAREREKERERRKKVADARRAEREAKEQRRTEKKQREKQRDREIRRETDEKRRYAKPYVESFDDEPSSSKLDKKSVGSKRHEEKGDRSSSRDDDGSSRPPTGPQRSFSATLDFAQSYIARAKNNGPASLQRSKTYHAHNVQPPAPTPPPMTGPTFPFPAPDDDARRPSARPHCVPGDGPTRERSYREASEEPVVLSASPSTRHAAQFQASAPASPVGPGPSLRRHATRTGSWPVDAGASRPVPGIARAQTMHILGETLARGRGRSRMQPQIEEESDSDEMYHRRTRDRDQTHRSSRRHRSPGDHHSENMSRRYQYHVDNSRATLQSTSSHPLTANEDLSRYHAANYGIANADKRPHAPARESNYTTSRHSYPKVRTTKKFSDDDVNYSIYDRLHHTMDPVYA